MLLAASMAFSKFVSAQSILCNKHCMVSKIIIIHNAPSRSLTTLRNVQNILNQHSNAKFQFLRPKWIKSIFNPAKRAAHQDRPYAFNPHFTGKLTNPLEVNTNVLNNVLLYRYEKEWLCKGAFFFTLFIMASLLSMCDNLYRVYGKGMDNLSFKDRLYKFAIPATAIFIGLTAGPIICIGAFIFSKRLVKFLILHKGGEKLTIVTHHPVLKSKPFTVSLEDVNCISNRFTVRSYAAFRLKGYKYWFFVDKNGQFINPELFDSTVGIARDI